MKKLILIAGIFLFAGAGFAQSTVTVDKNSSARTDNNAVEITAPAIPMDQKENYKIDPENYHKAVEDHARITDNNKPVIEVTVEAQKPGSQNNFSEKKEAVVVKNPKEKNSSKQKQKEIEINAAAVKQ
jgi:hypothetical protein